MFIRCARCHSYLAGPVELAAGMPAFGQAGNSRVPLVNVGQFHVGDGWLLLHPRWCLEWFRFYSEDWDEEERLDIGGGEPFVSSKEFGCCGPDGKARCHKGHTIGHIQGDCWHDQWLKLFRDRVETSDEADGEWTIYDLTRNRRRREHGRFDKGQRMGEWQIFEERPVRRTIRRRLMRKARWVEKEQLMLELQLVRLDVYENGERVASTDS